LGEPKDILDEYTNITGKASMPPLWSFGLWMSRISYFSEQDGRTVAKQLRDYKIPSDVIILTQAGSKQTGVVIMSFRKIVFKTQSK
jgi:alpha-glucosidase (family GH31 glycosyl hydrolase)